MMKVINVKNRIVGLVLVLIMLISCINMAFAYSEDTKTVKIGYFNYGSMCMGAEEGAEKSGYVYDFMQKISSYTGWKYEYTYGTYSELYDLLKEGKIDILPYTNWNEERSMEVLFSKDPIVEEKYYLATKGNDERFFSGDLSVLNGKRIASVTGADQNSVLKAYLDENGIVVDDIWYYGTPEESWDALEKGIVDAAVFSNISYRQNVTWNVFCNFGSKPTYVAISKGNDKLLSELDAAFDTLVQTNPSFMSELESIVSAGNPAMICLSEEEKAWLDAHDKIRLGYLNSDNLVYVSKDSNGNLDGFTVELINNIFSTLKINKKVEYFAYNTPEEMGEALLKNEVDIVYPFFPSFSYAEKYGFAISNNISVSNMAVIYKNNISPLEAMKKVVVPSASIAKYYMESNYPDSEVVIAKNENEAINMLRSGKVSGFVGKTVDMVRIAQAYNDIDEFVLSQECETSFVTNLGDSQLIVIMNRGISRLSKAELDALIANNTIATKINLIDYIKTHTEALILVILIPIFLAGLVVVTIVINKLRKKALVASNAKTAFLFNMSHDIRTPMNAILGYTDIALQHSEDKDKVVDSLTKIRTSSDHLLKLINDILEMSRIESGKLELIESPVDLNKSRDSVEQIGHELAHSKNIDFSVITKDIKNQYVYADELHINEVLINLISNSIKYTEPGGKVSYTVEQINTFGDKAKYRFVIEDNGIGMSQEYLSHIYESFSRERTSTVSKQEGTGLGLSIVKKIVDLAGGTIDCKSEVGVGTKFTVELSFRIMSEADAIKFVKDSEFIEKSTVNHSDVGEKVLLVEDNELNREIATEILEEYGFVVDPAEDGQKAIDKLNNNGVDFYDFILMDIQMPVMDGYEATKVIRTLKDGDKAIIIALSANAFEEDKKKSIELGMDAHIAKPINIKLLISTMEKLKATKREVK